jgi:hypothetical protein
MKTSDFALILATIIHAPHLGKTHSMILSGVMLVVAILAVRAERKQAAENRKEK